MPEVSLAVFYTGGVLLICAEIRVYQFNQPVDILGRHLVSVSFDGVVVS